MFDSNPQRREKKKKQEGLFKFWEFVDADAAAAQSSAAAVGQQVVVWLVSTFLLKAWLWRANWRARFGFQLGQFFNPSVHCFSPSL